MPMMVASGGGLHVWFQLTEDTPADTWQPLADKLKAR